MEVTSMARSKTLLLLPCASLCFAGLFAQQAQAGLINAGSTVQAFYYNGTLVGPEGEIPAGGSTSGPTSLATAVDYTPGALDLSTIHVGDTQISITNQSAFPFCFDGASAGMACADQISGFDFLFTGEDITGVTVDAISAADFQPVTGTFQGNTHLGLQLISSDEIRVDVTGDEPAVGDQLVLDLTFGASSTGTPVPEPTSLLLLGTALLGLAGQRLVSRRSRKRPRCPA
jgi:hypothetical protein